MDGLGCTCASTPWIPTCGRRTGAVAAVRPGHPCRSRSGEDVHKLSIALHPEEEKAGAPAGETRIIALVTETPISLLQLQTYVGASARLTGMTWGAEDLSAVLGARTNREDDGRTWTPPYQLARNLCLFAACAAECTDRPVSSNS